MVAPKQSPCSSLVRTVGFHPAEEGSIPFMETKQRGISSMVERLVADQGTSVRSRYTAPSF
jgi:hypothetical protein